MKDPIEIELNKLTDKQRKYVDENAMEIMHNDSVRHAIAHALRNTLRFESDFEANAALQSDEYEEISDNFITDAAYIAAIKRMNNQIRNAQDEGAVNELSNREVA